MYIELHLRNTACTAVYSYHYNSINYNKANLVRNLIWFFTKVQLFTEIQLPNL